MTETFIPSGYPLVCPCLVLPVMPETAAVVGDDVENFLHVGAASTARRVSELKAV